MKQQYELQCDASGVREGRHPDAKSTFETWTITVNRADGIVEAEGSFHYVVEEENELLDEQIEHQHTDSEWVTDDPLMIPLKVRKKLWREIDTKKKQVVSEYEQLQNTIPIDDEM